MIRRNTWLHRYRGEVYTALVGLMLLGLACSKIVLSLSLLTYVMFFLVFGDYTEFITRFKENRVWLGLLLFFLLLHILSCFWSSDLHAAWNGIRVRLSAVAIPILIATTMPWNKVRLITIFKGFLAVLIVLMIVNIVRFLYLIDHQMMSDIRQLTWFGSHIRFGILVSFAVGICWYLYKARQIRFAFAIVFIAFATAYTLYSQTFSAMLSWGIVALWMVYDIVRKKKWAFVLFIGMGLIGCIVSTVLMADFQQAEPFCGSFQEPVKASAAWKKKSSLDFQGKDRKNQALKRTCERYLCAKGAALAPAQIAQLTSQEVRDIENGFTDSHSARGSILGRYYELKYQFHHAENPNGHTLLQRFVYWKSSIEIIKQHVLIGVGIGDVESSLKERYKTTELLPENQKRPHNMFLTTWLICGVFGVLALLGLLFYFLLAGIKKRSALMVVFTLITFFTMMLEDSLETQVGASFFGLFIGLLCCHQATVFWSYKNH